MSAHPPEVENYKKHAEVCCQTRGGQGIMKMLLGDSPPKSRRVIYAGGVI